jgi:hypothetical protein
LSFFKVGQKRIKPNKKYINHYFSFIGS